MADIDFKFLMFCAIVLILWAAFNVSYTSDILETQNKLTSTKQDTGIIASLVATTEFLNPFSEEFKSDIFIINVFIFPLLIFGIVLCAARFIRGV